MSTRDPAVRVLLIGQGPTTLAALHALTEAFTVTSLVRTAGPADETVRYAALEGIPIIDDDSLARVERAVVDDAPDVVVVSSYSRIIPRRTIERVPFINVHYAPLPRYRGRATVNWAIINGEKSASISIHSIVPDLDAGAILYRGDVPITPTTTATMLYAQLNGLQRVHLAGAVRRRLSGDLGDPQDARDVSYACARVPSDGMIDWSSTTAHIDRLIRALTPPFPAAFTIYRRQVLHIRRAEPVRDAPTYVGRVPGRVVSIDRDNGGVDVLTADGVIRLNEVTLGGVEQRASDVVRSVHDTLGLTVTDVLAALQDAGRIP